MTRTLTTNEIKAANNKKASVKNANKNAPAKVAPVKHVNKKAAEAALAETKERKARVTNKDNRSNGTFTLVRRNDNRIRLTSGGKTIATIQLGKKVCSIHTATNDVYGKYLDKVTEYTMGPNSYKLTVASSEVDTVARELFGTCEERIIEEAPAKAEEVKA